MNDWRTMAYSYPESDALIEFKSGGTGYARDIRPESDAASLEWRYTGIALEFGYGKPAEICAGQASNALIHNSIGLGAASYPTGTQSLGDFVMRRWQFC